MLTEIANKFDLTPCRKDSKKIRKIEYVNVLNENKLLNKYDKKNLILLAFLSAANIHAMSRLNVVKRCVFAGVENNEKDALHMSKICSKKVSKQFRNQQDRMSQIEEDVLTKQMMLKYARKKELIEVRDGLFAAQTYFISHYSYQSSI